MHTCKQLTRQLLYVYSIPILLTLVIKLRYRYCSLAGTGIPFNDTFSTHHSLSLARVTRLQITISLGTAYILHLRCLLAYLSYVCIPLGVREMYDVWMDLYIVLLYIWVEGFFFVCNVK